MNPRTCALSHTDSHDGIGWTPDRRNLDLRPFRKARSKTGNDTANKAGAAIPSSFSVDGKVWAKWLVKGKERWLPAQVGLAIDNGSHTFPPVHM